MSCIDNIVTLGICPDELASKSGFTLMQAPGMSPKMFADIANEKDVTGTNMVMARKALTLLQVTNDFVGVLQNNNVVASMANPVYDSSRFNIGESMGMYDGYRGVTIHKTNRRGGLRKTIIKSIQLYPLAAGTVDVKIIDGYTETVYSVDLTSNSVNTILVDYTIVSKSAQILVDQSTIAFASAPITCLKGCGGSIPNDCAWVDGWNGLKAVKDEGYGINLQFYCHCDYEQIICDIRYMGEIIWLKWQINVYDEMYKSNRFNNWVIYGRDQLPDIISELEAKYVAKWNEMMGGLFGILNTYKDECLNCRGIKIVSNI